MAKRVCFITGADGRLGARLARRLVEENCEVRCLVINKELMNRLPAGCIPFVGNLSDTHVLEGACKGVDVVFHLAALLRSAEAATREFMEVNVRNTRNLLEVCEKSKIKHIIFTSTLDVYGRIRKETLTEESKPKPTDKYGYSKMLAEEEITKSSVPYTILRMATIYGPKFEADFFKIFRIIKEGKAVVIGNGKNHLALIHVDDVVEALLEVEENKKSLGKIYNLSDGVAYTQESLLGIAADMLGVKKPRRHIPELMVRLLARQRNLNSDELRFMTSNRVIDISKIKRELGFSPKVDIAVGGRELINMFFERSKKGEAKEGVFR